LRISEGWIYDLDTSYDRPGFWAATGDGYAYQYADYFYDLLEQVPTTHRELSGVAYVDAGVLVSGSEQRIELWDRSDETSWEWALKMTLEGHQGWVWDVDASSDEWIFASGGADRTVRLWNAEDGTSLGVLRGHRSTVTKIRFSPDNETLASASRDGTVRLWDVETGAELTVLEGHEDWVMDLAYSPDGSLLASVDANGEIILWDMTTGALLRCWPAHQGAARGVVFSPDGSLLITAGEDDKVKLWGIQP
jgi:WD40 repeat protein